MQEKVLIDKQAAIDAMRTMQTYKLFVGDDLLLIDQAGAMTELMLLPSAQPEQKKGKWIPQDLNRHDGMTSTAVYYYPKCSICGTNANYTNFCPNCGADMRGES